MSKCCKKLKMEIKLINYLLLTYRMRHGNSAEEGDTERERERQRDGERLVLAGEWRALERAERPRERERQRESRDRERLESGLWRALERPRQRERQSDGERLESGEHW
jgi:hypothetical protein